MKQLFKGLLGLSCFLLTFAFSLGAQENQPVYITMTTGHYDFDYTDGSIAEWMEIEKEYFDKVTSKNDLILASEWLQHYFTDDNTEFNIVNVYPSWEAIQKAGDRTQELVEAGWPDEAERDAFFKKQAAYYENQHSDEIYIGLSNVKHADSVMTESHVMYVQVQELAFPPDADNDEMQALRKEYVEAVYHNNPHVNGFYNMRHLWGSNNRDMVEVLVVKDLPSLDKALKAIGGLVEKHWPNEAGRDAFFEKYNKYFTGRHRDYIYRNTPELRK